MDKLKNNSGEKKNLSLFLCPARFVSQNKVMNSVRLVGLILFLCFSCLITSAKAEGITLTASWYSIDSLKKEGTYKHSKGVMANCENFNDNNFTCANRLFPLGTMLRITNLKSGKTVIVKTTDRIGKRFARTRCDLSKRAFAKIADCKQGIIQVKVEVI